MSRLAVGFACALALSWCSKAPPSPSKDDEIDLHAWAREQRKADALRSCRDTGGIPALGFDFNVVCIEGQVQETVVETGELRKAEDYRPAGLNP